jgi:hypothetical protein
MNKQLPQQNTPRVVAVAAALVAGFVAIGWLEGLFARLGVETVAALAIFACGFALATYFCDREVRAFVGGLLRKRERGDPAGGGTGFERRVPALEVRPRLAGGRQVQPAMRRASGHDVGRGESAAR